MSLPQGPPGWQFYHQNFARFQLKAHAKDRTPIDKMLAEIERIQGAKQAQIMKDFLNHEKQAMAEGVELVKPQCVIEFQKQLHRDTES